MRHYNIFIDDKIVGQIELNKFLSNTDKIGLKFIFASIYNISIDKVFIN